MTKNEMGDTPSSGGSESTDPSFSSAAINFWRAFARGDDEVARKALAAVPATTGRAFDFGEEEGDEDKPQGTHPSPTPTASLWLSTKSVNLHLLDLEVDCGGYVGADPRSTGGRRVCLEPREGADACTYMTHRKDREAKGYAVVEGLVIQSPKSKVGAKSSAFSEPAIPTERLPLEVLARQGSLLSLEARPGVWRTLLEWFPSEAAFKGFSSDAGETTDDEAPVEPDTYARGGETGGGYTTGGTTLEILVAKVSLMEERIEKLTEEAESARIKESVYEGMIREVEERYKTLAKEQGGRGTESAARETLRQIHNLKASVIRDEKDIADLKFELSDPSGQLSYVLNECKKIEARVDLEAVELGGDVYRSEIDAAALTATFPTEGYACVFDFVTLLFFSSDPYTDYTSVMATEQARIKAGYKSVAAARNAASHQVKYPPILMKTTTSGTEGRTTVTESLAAGMANFEAFSGPNRTGLKWEIKAAVQSIKRQFKGIILSDFKRGTTGYTFCEESLAQSSQQVMDWLGSIETFYEELLLSKMTAAKAWEAVLLYTRRLFDDIWEVRSVGRETRKESALVWSSLRAHRVLQEYTRWNFTEHPNVASMLTRYVLEHQGLMEKETGAEAAKKANKAIAAQKGAIDGLKSDLGNLSARVKKLE